MIKGLGGDVGGALLTPVRQIKTLLGQFDKSEAIMRETKEAPLLGPAAESIPYASKALGLPEAHRPTSAEPIHDEYPAAKFFPGTRVVAAKNFVEHELDRLRFDYSEIKPATGIPAADNIENRYMGQFIAKQAATLEKNVGYKHASDQLKAVAYLQPLLQQGRTYARAKLASERPDLYRQLLQKREPARMQEFKKSVAPKRISTLIPPKQPGENDTLYRARLLQVNRPSQGLA